MCWNEDISINTFVFSISVLVFIFFVNTYTKYKLVEFENPLLYLFLLEIAFVQLIEFFIWRNLKNKSINQTLSKCCSFLILLQQATLIFLIKNDFIKQVLFVIFLSFYGIYFTYRVNYNPIYFFTSVKNGNLSWEWMKFNGYEYLFVIFGLLLFYIIPLLLIDNIVLSLYILFFLATTLFFYFKNDTFGSMWCWSGNFLMIYFLINILLIKPFYDYNKVCV
jgi:hypothetical protein